MPKSKPPGWSARRDCRFDPLVQAAVAAGLGVIAVYGGCDSEERAHEVRRGIYRCANHRGLSVEAGKSTPAEPGDMGVHKTAGGTWEVRFRLYDKRKARARMIERYGTDRSKWPYDPRRPATTEEKSTW